MFRGCVTNWKRAFKNNHVAYLHEERFTVLLVLSSRPDSGQKSLYNFLMHMTFSDLFLIFFVYIFKTCTCNTVSIQWLISYFVYIFKTLTQNMQQSINPVTYTFTLNCMLLQGFILKKHKSCVSSGSFPGTIIAKCVNNQESMVPC